MKTTIGLPVSMAAFSFSFQCCATSFASGSSGLGADSKACIDSKTVRICNAGDHLSGRLNTNDLKYSISITRILETFQDIQADAPEFIDVRMIDFREEPDFWRSHGIIIWQKQFQIEFPTYKGCLITSFCLPDILTRTVEWRRNRPAHCHIKITKVFFVRNGCNAGGWIG